MVCLLLSASVDNNYLIFETMRKLLTYLAIVILMSSCEKTEDTTTTPAIKPTTVIGIMTINPIGNSSDAYRYRINSSNTLEGTYYSGVVSDGPLTINLIENSIYRIYFTSHTLANINPYQYEVQHIDTAIDDTTFLMMIDKRTAADAMNLTVGLPATIY
jgi:hypothetical protein